MRIEGKCHCGNIRYVLEWPEDGNQIQARVCGCTFCTKHGGSWTSRRDAALDATLADETGVTKYNFGTDTADFYVCSACGVVPFVTSAIDGGLYAVVNVNTFEGIDRDRVARAPISFDDEDVSGRLDRRKRNWIPSVRISGA